MYNDYNSFSKRTRAPEVETDRKKFDVPELMHNLNMLLDLTEDEIRRNDRHVRFLKVSSNTNTVKRPVINNFRTSRKCSKRTKSSWSQS